MNTRNGSRELTLNWHFENACNMRCKFCFAQKCIRTKVINHTTFLEKCSHIFNKINFVGGEPTIAPKLSEYVHYANSQGMRTSIVTNGFKAITDTNSSILYECFSTMDTVGFSIDSLDEKTNLCIGRSVNGRTISFSEAVDFCKKIKSLSAELKINTVINRFNLNEDFSNFIHEVMPNRWKIFQVMPTSNEKTNTAFCITETEFKNFISKHKQFDDIMHIESNEVITDSYIMVNADGYFIDTAPYSVKPTQNSLYKAETCIETEIKKMQYNLTKYDLRYKKVA